MPVGATLRVTNPADGNFIDVKNDPTNFGWEYVWHCHLLGHEENDMMRPMAFHVSPAAPSGLLATPGAGQVALAWTNNWTNPAATDNLIERATDAAFTQNVTQFTHRRSGDRVHRQPRSPPGPPTTTASARRTTSATPCGRPRPRRSCPEPRGKAGPAGLRQEDGAGRDSDPARPRLQGRQATQASPFQ